MKISKIERGPIWTFAFRNTLDVIANELSRQAFGKFKKVYEDSIKSRRIEFNKTFNFKFIDPSDGKRYFLQFNIFKKHAPISVITYGQAVKALDLAYLKRIRCDIIIGDLFDVTQYPAVVYKIKEEIRHEIEHFSKQPLTTKEVLERLDQASPFGRRRQQQMSTKGMDFPSAVEYFRSEREQMAFLRGFMAIAKNNKVPLSKVIKEEIAQRLAKYDHPDKNAILKDIINSYETKAKQIWPNYKE
jgi:hypothetical protein